MSKEILDHRERLIQRLLARNPLLSFRATKKGNRKISLLDFFDHDENLLENKWDLLKDKKDNFDIANNFLKDLIIKKKAKCLQSKLKYEIIARLKKMSNLARDLFRTTGQPAQFFAWPFAVIPREQKKPLFAPLLFWQIKNISINNELTIEIEEIPQPNYMLKEWIKIHKNLDLDFSIFENEENFDINSIIENIKKNFGKVQNCENKISENEPYKLKNINENEKNFIIESYAVIGITSFKYLSLLSDLKEIARNVNNNSCGLVDEFLDNPSQEVTNPQEAKPPQESDKYLVEKTDFSQEKAVWQAQHSKIMLLDGPPGTGKSQTIVNLIANSLQKKESVMLVCHQKAALDIVKKRLEDVGLGSLLESITDVKGQQRKFIKGIKEISDNNNIFKDNTTQIHEKTECEQEIIELEEQYNNQNKTFGNINKNFGERLYSLRGHLNGIIDKVLQQKKFNPRDNKYENLRQQIKQFSEEKAINFEKKDYIKEIRKFANDYKECDYENNCWKKAKNNIKDNKDFLPLLERAKELYNKTIPTDNLFSFLFESIAAPFSDQFFKNEKKEIAKEIYLLTKGTKDIFQQVGLNPIPIWRDIYKNNGGEKYSHYYKNLQHLQTIVSINKQLEKDKILATLYEKYYKEYKKTIDDLPEILESILCYWALDELPFFGIFNQSSNKKFKEVIKKKRKIVTEIILKRYKEQDLVGVLKSLQYKGLLRLKRYHNNPATTIRKLYHDAIEEVKSLRPVLLTNPDSMSQILPLKTGIIDLAIVDEASQMFLADALPILYRAKKIIISGDKMQMPPSDLFASLQDNDDENNGEENDEKKSETSEKNDTPIKNDELLDAIKQLISNDKNHCKLQVHYRSRPEELIAFSNHAFYGGRLQTAPDSYELKPPFRSPIEVIHSAGKFDKGINEKEIDEIIKHLTKIWDQKKPLSVGVIVFNVKQADRLNDRIYAESDHDSNFKDKYNKAIDYENEDGEKLPFFVRSVEHVQGDERDIIILGTTYGDNNKRYGPLSRKEKGRRRLNVAITRAKHGMFVITSLNIDHISSEGHRPDEEEGRESWYLWKFMQYAKAVNDKDKDKANEILQSLNEKYEPPLPSGKEPESQFEKDVGDYIKELGFEIDYQVGEHGFRIDIGVKKKSKYLCGIECDGRYWHSSWSARHNDVWRQEILEDKGWKIYRILSDDWYYGKDKEQNKLKDFLEKLKKENEVSATQELTQKQT